MRSGPAWGCGGFFAVPSTLGEAEGYIGGAPLSPEAAMNVTPAWPSGLVKKWSSSVSPANSPEPQLMETAHTPGCEAA